jgi:hypothetical protein
MSKTVSFNFKKLNLSLGADVYKALEINRVLFSPFEAPYGDRGLFVIGRNVKRMQDELAAVAPFDGETYLILVTDEHLESIDRDSDQYEGTAAILDLAGEQLGEIRVNGGFGPILRTEHGEQDTSVVPAEQIEKGRVFATGDSRLPDGRLELLRALEDYSPKGFPVHILTRTWDTASDADKEDLTKEFAPPATQLVFMVSFRGNLLDAIGVEDIATV